MQKINTIYFICSPSLGILDNWLPVIHKLRDKYPNAELVCVITKSTNAELIDTSNILIRISEKLFDSIIYKSNSGCWFKSKSFFDAKKANTPFLYERFLLISQRVCLKSTITASLSSFISLFYRFHDLLSQQRKISLSKLGGKRDVVLYDIYEETKEYNRDLLNCFKGAPKFSIGHGGINVEQKTIENRTIDQSNGCLNEVSAFLFSKNEKSFYKNIYSLESSDIHIMGFARHNEKWISYLNSIDSEQKNQSWDNYIFIISRPLSEYFTLDRKIQAIKDIKELAFNNLALRLVIKLHPKEQDYKIYENVLGKDTYETQWRFSNDHPFLLSKKCIFAIAFFSGVVIDMAALKVPAIEFLNMRGLKKFDNENSLRDESGEPVLEYRYSGIVLGASDYEQLSNQATHVMENRTIITNMFYKRYCELFPDPNKSVLLAVNKITK